MIAAAHRLPTSQVELEDAWVTKRGGLLYPELWVTDRTRFPGGWILTEGAEASARPIAGGHAVAVAIDWTYIRNSATPLTLALAVDDRVVARLPGDQPGVWRHTETGPVDFPPGAALRLTVESPPGAVATNGFVVDRLELDWR